MNTHNRRMVDHKQNDMINIQIVDIHVSFLDKHLRSYERNLGAE